MRDALMPGPAEAPPLAAQETLERIADLLGCPVSTFHAAGGASLALTGGAELLALWDTLRTDASREALLRFARSVAANE